MIENICSMDTSELIIKIDDNNHRSLNISCHLILRSENNRRKYIVKLQAEQGVEQESIEILIKYVYCFFLELCR